MAFIGKKRKAANTKIDAAKLYTLKEASTLVKEVNVAKFDASVTCTFAWVLTPKKQIRLYVVRLHCLMAPVKQKKVLVRVLLIKNQMQLAQEPDHVGLDEFIQKIESGWTDIDVVIATPQVMPKIGKLGKILGPRNLMPNPKTGTVTNDVAAAVNDVKGGKIAFKVDKSGIIHASIGRVSFSPEKIAANGQELINALIKAKPSTAKGTYLKGISMASTMSPGIALDTKSFVH
ncbi:MAG: 50S ribosomal protein L1 [Sphingobacteriales bacterium]|nr:50S ribosomal protein L1 [Sphingobacteriales bacterium]